MSAEPAAPGDQHRTFVDELRELGGANWTGNAAESVFRIRSLMELSAGCSTEHLVRLAAAHGPSTDDAGPS